MNEEPIIEIKDHPFNLLVRSSDGKRYYTVQLDYFSKDRYPFPAYCNCPAMGKCWNNQKKYPDEYQPYCDRNGINPHAWHCVHIAKAMTYRMITVMKQQAEENNQTI